ncbi:MAG: hypothetical protein GY838_03975 [bacterium]|nr:hypothetical protein [bacterium]
MTTKTKEKRRAESGKRKAPKPKPEPVAAMPQLPALEDATAASPDPPPADPTPPAVKPGPSEAATITIPVTDPVPGGYRTNHADVQFDTRQSEALHHVLAGLDAAGERLDNGRRVHHKVDAVKWVFDKIADQLGL